MEIDLGFVCCLQLSRHIAGFSDEPEQESR